MNMKRLLFFCAVILSTLPARAQHPSVLGGSRLSTNHVHHFGLGWPSVFYEYWMRARKIDWAIGGELVYGDYVGQFSDVDIGFGFHAPIKWNLSNSRNTAVAFRLAPGLLIADAGGTLFGIRSELGLPVSIKVSQDVNIVTGGNIPFALLFPDQGDTLTFIPIFARIGAEFGLSRNIIPSILMELGPVFGFGNGSTDTDFGIRVWASAILF